VQGTDVKSAQSSVPNSLPEFNCVYKSGSK